MAKPMTRAYSSYSAADGSEWCSPSMIGDLETLDLRNAASATLDSCHLPTPSKRSSRAAISAGTANESDISMSDISEEEEDEPKSPRKKGGAQKRKTGGSVFRDDNGRVISRDEAKRIRKRKTNRDSARRMRLLRKQQHDNLQQEVQDKSIDLQRAVAMNRQITASYDNLQGQFATMEKRDNAIVYATIELLSHISQNIGSQLESSALANFLRQVVPYLPSTKYLPIKDELLVKSSKLIPKHIHVDATSFEENHVHHQASPSSASEDHRPAPSLVADPPLIQPSFAELPTAMDHSHTHFDMHSPGADTLLMPPPSLMTPQSAPIVRLDGSTGSGFFKDGLGELLKLPSLEALLDKQASLEALDIMDFLRDLPNERDMLHE